MGNGSLRTPCTARSTFCTRRCKTQRRRHIIHYLGATCKRAIRAGLKGPAHQIDTQTESETSRRCSKRLVSIQRVTEQSTMGRARLKVLVRASFEVTAEIVRT